VRKRNPPSYTTQGEWFVLSVYPTKNKQGKAKIAVPRALFPLSTSRNRLKRQIREVIRLSHEEAEKDLLIIVKKRGTPSFGAVQKEILTHLKKMRPS